MTDNEIRPRLPDYSSNPWCFKVDDKLTFLSENLFFDSITTSQIRKEVFFFNNEGLVLGAANDWGTYLKPDAGRLIQETFEISKRYPHLAETHEPIPIYRTKALWLKAKNNKKDEDWVVFYDFLEPDVMIPVGSLLSLKEAYHLLKKEYDYWITNLIISDDFSSEDVVDPECVLEKVKVDISSEEQFLDSFMRPKVAGQALFYCDEGVLSTLSFGNLAISGNFDIFKRGPYFIENYELRSLDIAMALWLKPKNSEKDVDWIMFYRSEEPSGMIPVGSLVSLKEAYYLLKRRKEHWDINLTDL